MNLDPLTNYLLDLPRPVKRLIALALDSIICALSVWFAFYLRLGEWVAPTKEPFYPIIVALALALPIFMTFGLYRAIFRYAGTEALLAIARAVAVYAVPFTVIYTMMGVAGVPRTVGLIQPILLFLMIGATRAFGRMILGETYLARWRAKDMPHVMIYGAGAAGRQLASAISTSREMRLSGFVDDDPKLWGSTMNGVRIYGPDDLNRFAPKHKITDILLAIPSATRARRGEIVTQMRELGVHVRTLPSFVEMARGKVSVNDLRELDIEDLLGRPPVPPDEALLRKNIENKIVLVTGAGGSIGSELCRQILRARPAELLLLELNEYNLYMLHQELKRTAGAEGIRPAIVPLLGSVSDERCVDAIMSTWRPETIFHAAAYKHVPLVEHNIVEGVRNNVLGTLNMARLSRRHGVKNFVLISTDKAVRPTNAMGASKRLAEMILQAMQAEGGAPCYSMVRFGNVLGSSGSVVPLFRGQVATGGPVTVTHKDVTRYFMTIPEAAQLVLQAGSMARGGDVFVLDMGEPVRVIDLARNIIELSGLTVRDENNPDGDIEIQFDGLRPGEKLYEELLIGDDASPTAHPRIMRSHETFIPWAELQAVLEDLEILFDSGDAERVVALLERATLGYTPNSPLADWVSTANKRLRVVS
jgi:FlaA1/EpsC-like NDP-sugar epimerase